MTQEASVAHNAYGEIQEGILQTGGRAPDALGLVSVITPDLAPHCIPSGSQLAVSLPGGMAGGALVPVVQSIPVILQETVLKELVKRLAALPSSESAGHVESRTSSEENETIHEGEIKVVVVRLDGVAGAIARGAAGLERYFEGVFEKKGSVLATENAMQI
ncbi:hypothetical protein EDD17DRAFT_1837509 [Pisolithus thermaeus]|nr:hypothetical protein EV401DRAFT_2210068 [Pisolithus croceorrhizus]KAI6159774.1 hypothetical protein EDD17DRAFT_1837509 [Pisolithus thermaeus]